MAYKKLIALGAAVATLATYTFAFNDYNSQDSLIKQGIDNLKQVALNYKGQLEELQGEYNSLLGDLNSTQDALQQARLKLQAIYQKITGTEWDEANGDILDFDFDNLLKDGEQFDNNVDGDAIADILGLPHGATTEEIIVAIQDLIATVQSLEQRIQQLEGQVADLEGQIAEYKTEEQSLVEEINGLKTKLDEATAQANAIIDGASQEEQAQLEYVNDVLEELGEERILTEEESLGNDMNAKWEIVVAELSDKFTNDELEEIKRGEYTITYQGGYSLSTNSGTKKTIIEVENTAINEYEAAKESYINAGGSIE